MIENLRKRYKEAKDPIEKEKIKRIGQQKKYELMVRLDKLKRQLIEDCGKDEYKACVIRELFI